MVPFVDQRVTELSEDGQKHYITSTVLAMADGFD
jgi:hypothetical protein